MLLQVEIEEKHHEITTLSSCKEEEAQASNRLLGEKDDVIKRLENEVETLKRQAGIDDVSPPSSNHCFEQLGDEHQDLMSNFVRDMLANSEVLQKL